MPIDWAAIGSWTLLVLGMGFLLLVNAVGVALVAFQLPGTWLILLATVLAGWMAGLAGWLIFGWPSFVTLLLLAMFAELVEFAGGAAGARIAGAGRRAAWMALAGSILGAIAGTFAIPVPVVGTLAGAAIGAAAGSILGDRWEGRLWRDSIKGGGGAAVGKLGGAVGKLAVAAVMWLVVLLAMIL